MKSLLKTIALVGIAALSVNVFAGPGEGGKGQKGKGPSFSRLDTDSNGGVSLDEFLHSRVSMAEKRFAKNGATESEIADRIGKMQMRMEKLFAKADRDENGELSKEEFKKVAMMGGKGGKKKKPEADS